MQSILPVDRWDGGSPVSNRIIQVGASHIAEWGPLTARVHEGIGTFWHQKRTLSLLTPEYWWAGMYADVGAFVQACSVCDRGQGSVFI